FARTIAAESAKPLKTARVEAQRAVSTFTFAAVEARRLAGDVVPMDAADVGGGKLAFTLRLPLGVVGGITPFHFPLNLVAHKVGLELGNNSPVIVEADGDWSTAATKIAVAGFSHAGQSCISTQRVYVQEAVLDDFLAALVPKVEALVVGDPLDERTDVSSLIT